MGEGGKLYFSLSSLRFGRGNFPGDSVLISIGRSVAANGSGREGSVSTGRNGREEAEKGSTAGILLMNQPRQGDAKAFLL